MIQDGSPYEQHLCSITLRLKQQGDMTSTTPPVATHMASCPNPYTAYYALLGGAGHPVLVEGAAVETGQGAWPTYGVKEPAEGEANCWYSWSSSSKGTMMPHIGHMGGNLKHPAARCCGAGTS